MRRQKPDATLDVALAKGVSVPTRAPFEYVPWKLSDVAIAIGLIFASFFVLALLVGVATSTIGEEGVIELTPWLFGIFEGLMVVFAWFFSIRKYHVSWQALGLRMPEARWSFALPWAVLFGSLLFAFIYETVVEALGIEALEPPPVPAESLGEGATRALNVVVIGLWGPFAEEVFFRGFLLAAFVARLGAAWAVVASAAVFAIAHLEIGSLIPIFVVGLLFGWLYLRTRSLWPPIMAHMLQNIIALADAFSDPSAAMT